MRPIEKKSVGQIISYEDSLGVQVNHEIPEEYNQYGDAKLPLISNLGRYCSYCEGVRDVDALDIFKDVIRPKQDTILMSKDGSIGIAYKVEKEKHYEIRR